MFYSPAQHTHSAPGVEPLSLKRDAILRFERLLDAKDREHYRERVHDIRECERDAVGQQHACSTRNGGVFAVTKHKHRRAALKHARLICTYIMSARMSDYLETDAMCAKD